jgi:hypothetical protein
MNEHIQPNIVRAHYRDFFYPSLINYPELYFSIFPKYRDDPNRPIAYLCPICLKNGFISTTEIGIEWTSEFSSDHYPPANVGGKHEVLVCKKCNNDAGGQYENELVKQMAIRSHNKEIPGATLDVRSTISSIKGNYKIQINIMDDGKHGIVYKPNEKSKIPLLDNWLEESKTNFDWSAAITVTDADETKVSKAMLKAAYLFCFEKWGYEFVLSNTGENIRAVIMGEKIYPLKMPSLWLTDNLKGVALKPGVYWLSKPDDWQKFIVVMELNDLKTGYKDIVGIIIPGPEIEAWADLTRIHLILDADQGNVLTFNEIVAPFH